MATSYFIHHLNTFSINPNQVPLFSRNQKLAKKVHVNLCTAKSKVTDGNDGAKPKSVICSDCDGNGAVLCSQCKGSGVNSVDFFNGEFKAGDSCWLCGGKKDMLCGNCNGAGFMGGFMTSFDT